MNPNFKKAEKEAGKFWKKYKSQAPPIPILDVAKDVGLNVLEVDFKNHPDVSGILDPKKSIIYLNRSDSPEQKRFTIAYEIGLWLMHREELVSNSSLSIFKPESFRNEEKCLESQASQAYYFATHLLVPDHIFKELQDLYSRKILSDIFAVDPDVFNHLCFVLQVVADIRANA